MRVGLGTAVTVTATEIWLSNVRAGKAFALGTTVAAVGGQNSHIQLFNPGASGKQVVVRQLLGSTGTADTIQIRFHNTQLATDAGAGVNLLSGGAAAAAHVFSTTNAGLLGTLLEGVSLLASTPWYFAPEWLCELSPGQGVVLANVSVNIALAATFYWMEL